MAHLRVITDHAVVEAGREHCLGIGHSNVCLCLVHGPSRNSVPNTHSRPDGLRRPTPRMHPGYDFTKIRRRHSDVYTLPETFFVVRTRHRHASEHLIPERREAPRGRLHI